VLGDQSAGSLADPDKPSVSETKDDCPGMDGCDEPPGEPEQQIDPHAQPETTQDEASSPPLKTPSNRTETPSQCLPIDEAC